MTEAATPPGSWPTTEEERGIPKSPKDGKGVVYSSAVDTQTSDEEEQGQDNAIESKEKGKGSSVKEETSRMPELPPEIRERYTHPPCPGRSRPPEDKALTQTLLQHPLPHRPGDLRFTRPR